VVETGVSVANEFIYQRNDLPFWFSVTYSKFGDGFINVWKDITKKKRAAM
jgi:hypothetical protein